MKGLAAIVLLLAVPAAGWVYVATRVDEGLEERATVTRVVDGDTLIVQEGGERDRVRVLGIDTPELGSCLGSLARSEARRLAQGRHIALRIDPTQRRRDRYGRLLAYVQLPNGRDLGLELIRAGYAAVLVVGRPFQRVDAYRRAARQAPAPRC